jgi:hypothetical protein
VVLDKAWAAATDRDHRIRGRHSRAYYKHADSWLNSEVEAARIQSENPGEAARHFAEAMRARESMMAVASELEA